MVDGMVGLELRVFREPEAAEEWVLEFCAARAGGALGVSLKPVARFLQPRAKDILWGRRG